MAVGVAAMLCLLLLPRPAAAYSVDEKDIPQAVRDKGEEAVLAWINARNEEAREAQVEVGEERFEAKLERQRQFREALKLEATERLQTIERRRAKAEYDQKVAAKRRRQTAMLGLAGTLCGVLLWMRRRRLEAGAALVFVPVYRAAEASAASATTRHLPASDAVRLDHRRLTPRRAMPVMEVIRTGESGAVRPESMPDVAPAFETAAAMASSMGWSGPVDPTKTGSLRPASVTGTRRKKTTRRAPTVDMTDPSLIRALEQSVAPELLDAGDASSSPSASDVRLVITPDLPEVVAAQVAPESASIAAESASGTTCETMAAVIDMAESGMTRPDEESVEDEAPTTRPAAIVVDATQPIAILTPDEPGTAEAEAEASAPRSSRRRASRADATAPPSMDAYAAWVARKQGRALDEDTGKFATFVAPDESSSGRPRIRRLPVRRPRSAERIAATG